MTQLIRALIVNDEDSRQPAIAVQYNPKEIQVDKTVPWQQHPRSHAEVPGLEYTSGNGKNLAVELLLDGYEAHESVQDTVDQLERLTVATDIQNKRRPPVCSFIWGARFPKFRGVVESLQVKYTMFLPDGAPCRAVVSLKLKQADPRAMQAPANHRKAAEAAGKDDIRS